MTTGVSFKWCQWVSLSSFIHVVYCDTRTLGPYRPCNIAFVKLWGWGRRWQNTRRVIGLEIDVSHHADAVWDKEQACLSLSHILYVSYSSIWSSRPSLCYVSPSRSSVHFTIHKLLINYHSHILCYRESMVKIKVETLMEISVFGYCPLRTFFLFLSKYLFVWMRTRSILIKSTKIYQLEH